MRKRTTVYQGTTVCQPHGWDLHVDGVGVIQVATLDDAERHVREYIESVMNSDLTGAKIGIVKADALTQDEAASMDKDERPGQ